MLETAFMENDLEQLAEARSASRRADWEQAGRLWQDILRHSPQLDEAWLSASSALRQQGRFSEAELILSKAQLRFPEKSEIASVRARNAADMGDWSAAETLWNGFLNSFPEKPAGYTGLGSVLKHLGRATELESFLDNAVALFPNHFEIAFHRASLPTLEKRWPEAVDRLSVLRKRFPKERSVLIGLADALREMGRLDEADQILGQSREQFPKAVDVACSYAQLAMHREPWLDALLRWDGVLRAFPDQPSVYLGMNAALKRANLPALREHLLETAVMRFPKSVGIAIEQYGLAVERRDWPTARTQISHLLERYPENTKIASDYGVVLIQSGASDEAEEFLAAAIERFPRHLGLKMSFARAAAARSDLATALDRWTALQETYPESAGVREELSRVRFAIAHQSIFTGGDDPESDQNNRAAMINVPRTATSDNLELVISFESLGENCEFGLFQRAVGAEPLGLMRFAGVVPAKLIAALDCRFEGVGTPEHTVLRNAGKEYVSTDKRFGMTSHTFIDPATADYEDFYKKTMQKLRFLRRKFIEDLENGEKIFVYKVRWALSAAHQKEIERALLAYGPAKLLVVRLADGAMQNGDLEVHNDHMMTGYIDRHGDQENGAWDVPVESWLTLCRKARQIWPASA